MKFPAAMVAAAAFTLLPRQRLSLNAQRVLCHRNSVTGSLLPVTRPKARTPAWQQRHWLKQLERSWTSQMGSTATAITSITCY